ncbi:aminotransferase class V-fold PLP-dependent enzyme [Rhizobium leguminosarum bv. viciae]|uniref:NifS-like cysteine desulfurase/selenocysteine lyase n=1 Tax=Rhizobium johnstonii (strain DSM 114642 / LMG 32736 / 3841) TaxID=216596 RepID=Q1M9F8_RHIJ3|nr:MULTISPECIES: aminotransferase class V-fold PLP-dependent enzyme [Rhizobium]MBX5160761.1 aminotransferase class V-fold PLP-dependent enzyme [Rhizobium sp. NZLR8]MBY5344903.1 aminotransferase class V-fold PLP-dependent enzyme [Rhizobium leguminosarum]MBY5481219.1 aminotransferase class V-fold PLP-dependent enzyme [Rhizobium leguminosarum]MBY5847924.1 aminotransferase class V-fold PLP-dependent enzyme [Rhizobium leguminosarum]TAT71132.1 aminotransferase class V-fold PLP-dependent enzyme [Rhiz
MNAHASTRHQTYLNAAELAVIRSQYPIVKECIYWNNAAVSPISIGVRDAIARQATLHATDTSGIMVASAPTCDKGRSLAAKLVGSTAERIAYIQNTSHGLSLVALGIDWKPGDNLVVPELEFPSNFLIWETLSQQGVEIRTMKARNGALAPDDLRFLVDSRTKLVAVSHVQFYSGFRVDLAGFSQICADHDALLVVDGTQSVGVLSVDMEGEGVDVLVVSAHKWMLGPVGIGFAAFSERAFERIKPRIVGWLSVNDAFSFHRVLDFLPDAKRFEPGTENGAGIFGLAKRLEEIDSIGMEKIESYVMELGARIRTQAKSAGYEIMSDWPEESQSGIILLKNPKMATSVLFADLDAADVKCSVRNDAVRFSPHYYSNEDELALVSDVLRGAASRANA